MESAAALPAGFRTVKVELTEVVARFWQIVIAAESAVVIVVIVIKILLTQSR